MTRVIILTLTAGLAAAQSPRQPDVINGKVETRVLAGTLTQEFHQLEASATSPLSFVPALS